MDLLVRESVATLFIAVAGRRSGGTGRGDRLPRPRGARGGGRARGAIIRPVPEAAAKPIPRRGRLRVLLLLALGAFALAVAIYEISTREAGDEYVRLQGVQESRRLFGGVPQEADRLGSADAPVTIQVFNDVQCSDCREPFLEALPTLAEEHARPGEVKLLYRHYSNSRNPIELGFYGAEAAAEQNYMWNYVFLFFRNQEEAERLGLDESFLEAVASGIEELDLDLWRRDLERGSGPDGALTARLERDEELGRDLRIRLGGAMVVTGPRGTRTLQEGPSLEEIEAAIAAVR